MCRCFCFKEGLKHRLAMKIICILFFLYKLGVGLSCIYIVLCVLCVSTEDERKKEQFRILSCQKKEVEEEMETRTRGLVNTHSRAKAKY